MHMCHPPAHGIRHLRILARGISVVLGNSPKHIVSAGPHDFRTDQTSKSGHTNTIHASYSPKATHLDSFCPLDIPLVKSSGYETAVANERCIKGIKSVSCFLKGATHEASLQLLLPSTRSVNLHTAPLRPIKAACTYHKAVRMRTSATFRVVCSEAVVVLCIPCRNLPSIL